MRACTKCGETKPLEAFPPVRRGEERLQTWCRDCFAAYGRAYYRRHRDSQKARLLRNSATTRADNRAMAIAYLRAHPCVDCGEADVVVLQFDHLRDKRTDVATLINSGATWHLIEEEIAKCEVRCANCHRMMTALRYLERQPARTSRPTAEPEQLRIEDTRTRECRVCGRLQPLTSFPFRSRVTGSRHTICLSCQREASRAWYLRRAPHARRVTSYGARVRESHIARVEAFLSTHPCVDCGETNIAVLDFDHLRDKLSDVSSLIRATKSWAEVSAEIATCAVRCANCHARRTARSVGAYRLTPA